jgi:hypothetical protein
MAHIDRSPMDRERLLDSVDGTDDPGAEAARGTEQNVEGWLGHDLAMWRDEAPPVKRERRLFAAGIVPQQAAVRDDTHVLFPFSCSAEEAA